MNDRLLIYNIIYNVLIVVAIALIGVGSAFEWGWPISLIAVGALVISLTIFMLLTMRRSS